MDPLEPVVNAFSVDVEDYFHVGAFADRIRPGDWGNYPSRVADNTRRILALLSEHNVRGTFFVLGWVAEREPGLVRDIAAAGHEIACHGYWHQLVYDQSEEEFRDDLRSATEILRNLTDQPVLAYRAPSFSITNESLWALDVLIEQEYRIDSSIYPVRHDTYGIPDADVAPHVIQREAGRILEFPPAVRQKWFGNIPVAGGGYFRIYPLSLSGHWLRNINTKEHRPFVFYIHPWEIDPDQPRISSGLKSRFRHYKNLHKTERRLKRLLGRFRFSTVSDVLQSELAQWQESPIPTPHIQAKAVVTAAK